MTELADLAAMHERSALAASIEEIRKEQERFRSELAENSKELAENSKLTKSVDEKTTEIVELFGKAKGAFAVLGWIGTAVKWIGGIAMAAGAIYAFVYTMMHGFPPSK